MITKQVDMQLKSMNHSKLWHCTPLNDLTNVDMSLNKESNLQKLVSFNSTTRIRSKLIINSFQD